MTLETIDHVQVDTGSSGLRIVWSVLNANMTLKNETSGGQQVVECTEFADGYTWGPVKLADVRAAGESAQSVPIQVIGDPAYPAQGMPNNCSNNGAGPAENTVATFGANGLIGVGLFKQDCGVLCQSNDNGFYFLCPCTTSTGSSALADLNLQVLNPVALFANDNNGVMIQLPSAPASGAPSLSGALVFGIATQTNNGLGSAKVYTVDDTTGYFSTSYKNRPYTESLLDTGSSVLFFNDNTIALCGDEPVDPGAGFYCPASPLSLSGDVTGQNNDSAILDFQVANATNLLSNNSLWAFGNLAAPAGDNNTFIWGLPAFMGRKIYAVIEGQNVSNASTPDASVGPYFAF